MFVIGKHRFPNLKGLRLRVEAVTVNGPKVHSVHESAVDIGSRHSITLTWKGHANHVNGTASSDHCGGEQILVKVHIVFVRVVRHVGGLVFPQDGFVFVHELEEHVNVSRSVIRDVLHHNKILVTSQIIGPDILELIGGHPRIIKPSLPCVAGSFAIPLEGSSLCLDGHSKRIDAEIIADDGGQPIVDDPLVVVAKITESHCIVIANDRDRTVVNEPNGVVLEIEKCDVAVDLALRDSMILNHSIGDARLRRCVVIDHVYRGVRLEYGFCGNARQRISRIVIGHIIGVRNEERLHGFPFHHVAVGKSAHVRWLCNGVKLWVRQSVVVICVGFSCTVPLPGKCISRECFQRRTRRRLYCAG